MLPDKTRISDFYHLILDFWLKMVQYSPVDIRIHHQSAADHQQIMHIWILCQNVLSGNISFSRNQDQKQNEVNRCLFPITMIVSIDFRPFSEWKSENFQNVLSGNGGSGNHRMLLLLWYCIKLPGSTSRILYQNILKLHCKILLLFLLIYLSCI